MTMRKLKKTRYRGARRDAETLNGFFRPDELAAARAAEKRFRAAEARHYADFRRAISTSTSST
jgi:hypothetical protein